jgi:hypothetical protein
MFTLTQRIKKNEMMDDPNIPFAEFQQTLSEIEKINRLTNAYGPTLNALELLVQKERCKKNPLRILDIGFGNGDHLRRIHLWAQERGIAVSLTGIDLNPWAKQAAHAATVPGQKICFLTKNIFDHVPSLPYHIIVNSLFTHHLTNDEIIRVLKWMTQQSLLGWFVNDLHRHVVPYHFIRTFVRVLDFNRLVRNDAPLSVARAFTREDWLKLIARTKINDKNVKITWHWPFRYGVFYANN